MAERKSVTDLIRFHLQEQKKSQSQTGHSVKKEDLPKSTLPKYSAAIWPYALTDPKSDLYKIVAKHFGSSRSILLPDELRAVSLLQKDIFYYLGVYCQEKEKLFYMLQQFIPATELSSAFASSASIGKLEKDQKASVSKSESNAGIAINDRDALDELHDNAIAKIRQKLKTSSLATWQDELKDETLNGTNLFSQLFCICFNVSKVKAFKELFTGGHGWFLHQQEIKDWLKKYGIEEQQQKQKLAETNNPSSQVGFGRGTT